MNNKKQRLESIFIGYRNLNLELSFFSKFDSENRNSYHNEIGGLIDAIDSISILISDLNHEAFEFNDKNELINQLFSFRKQGNDIYETFKTTIILWSLNEKKALMLVIRSFIDLSLNLLSSFNYNKLNSKYFDTIRIKEPAHTEKLKVMLNSIFKEDHFSYLNSIYPFRDEIDKMYGHLSHFMHNKGAFSSIASARNISDEEIFKILVTISNIIIIMFCVRFHKNILYKSDIEHYFEATQYEEPMDFGLDIEMFKNLIEALNPKFKDLFLTFIRHIDSNHLNKYDFRLLKNALITFYE